MFTVANYPKKLWLTFVLSKDNVLIKYKFVGLNILNLEVSSTLML